MFGEEMGVELIQVAGPDEKIVESCRRAKHAAGGRKEGGSQDILFQIQLIENDVIVAGVGFERSFDKGQKDFLREENGAAFRRAGDGTVHDDVASGAIQQIEPRGAGDRNVRGVGGRGIRFQFAIADLKRPLDLAAFGDRRRKVCSRW